MEQFITRQESSALGLIQRNRFKYIDVIILTCRHIVLLFSSYSVEQWQVSQFLGAFSLTCVIVLIRIVCHDNIIFGIKFDSIVLCIIMLIRKLPYPMIKLPTSNL